MKKFFMVALAAMSLGVIQSSAAPLIYGTFNLSNGSVLTFPVVTATTLSFSTNPIFLIQGEPTSTFSILDANDTVTSSTLALTSALAFSFDFVDLSASTTRFTFTPTSFQGANFVNISTSGTVTSYDIFLLGNYTGAGYDSSVGELNINFRTPASGNPSVFAASGSGQTTVPEPSTYAMLGSALVGLGLLRRRKA